MTSLGIVLLVAGALAAVAEAHSPTHGVAGGVGVVALALGAVLAISGLGVGVVVAALVGVGIAGGGAAALLVAVQPALAASRRRVRTGAEAMVGHIGVVRSWAGQAGSVALDGALWRARRSPSADEEDGTVRELHPGDPVVVERLSGLTVSVRPAEEWELL
jgi:membrane-bound ClpP family serine protease